MITQEISTYNIRFKIIPGYIHDSIRFIDFLKNIGVRTSVQIDAFIKGNYLSVAISYEKYSGKVGDLLQEILLNNVLYYYSNYLPKKRRSGVIKNVIAPICRKINQKHSGLYGLSISRITQYCNKPIPRHIYYPHSFGNKYSNEYEVLYERWQMGLLSDWELILNLDALLNKFLLMVLKHKTGNKSENFDALLSKAKKKGIAIDSDYESCFTDIHNARTAGLHRLKYIMKKEKLRTVIGCLYNYFIYYDEYYLSRKELTINLNGSEYPKIKYGEEIWLDEKGHLFKNEDGTIIDWVKIAQERPCHDCGVVYGEIHVPGCDIEQCPRCKGSLCSCFCERKYDE